MATETEITPESAEPLSMPETPCSHGLNIIIARNLPCNTSLEDLHEQYRLYGDIRDISLPRQKDPHHPQYGSICGFAIIKYKTTTQSAHAIRAISEHGLSIGGKEVTVEFAKSDTASH